MTYRYDEFDEDCWRVYSLSNETRDAYVGSEDFAQEIVAALNAVRPNVDCPRCEQVREIVGRSTTEP